MARPVRVVESDRYYLLTNRCLLGMFLLRPDDECNRILRGCLARAAEKYNVELVCYVFLSNHFHLIARFPDLNMAEFMEELQSQIASRINKHRGRKGTFFPQRYDDQAILDDETLLDKICYVVNNPVKDRLVPSAEEWPGVTSMDVHESDGVLEGQWLNGRRWYNLKRRKGDHEREEAMDVHRVELHLPDALDGETREERRQALVELVTDDRHRIWASTTGDRNRAPRTPKRGELLSASWSERAEEPFDPFKRRRLCMGYTMDGIRDYREMRRQINRDYRDASRAWRRREVREFPHGTYPPGWRHCVGSPARE